MPASTMNHFQPINQSSAVMRKADSQLFSASAPNPGAGFEAVLRDVRRPGNSQDIAAANGKKVPPGGDLHKYALGPRVKIITSSDPTPDEQSLIAFARAEGIDEALLELIMRKKAVPEESTGASAPDPAAPLGVAGQPQAVPPIDLVLASIGLAAEAVRAPIPQLNTLAAAGATTITASGPEFAPPGAPLWASPASVANANTGAPGLPVAPDALARPTAGPAPIATAAADTTTTASSPQFAPAAGPRPASPASAANTNAGAPGLPLVPAAAVLNGAGTRAVAAAEAPSVQGKPVDAAQTAAKSVEGPAAPILTPNEAPAAASDLPPGLTRAVLPQAPTATADAGQAVPDPTAADAPAGDGKGSPGSVAPATGQDAVQDEQSPRKEALYEHPAMPVRPESQKSGKSRSEGNPTAALRGADAPAAAAEQPHWDAENAINPVSAAASEDSAQRRGGAAQDLDLGGAAPAHEESMQDAHFRRSEQYQMLSDRVSEAIGQRLSAQIAKGTWQASMQLNPSHLGKIDIRLSMRGSGTIDAEFNASQAHTKDLLLNGLPRLKEIMAESGIDLSRMDVKHEGASAHGGNPRARQPLPAAGSPGHPSPQAPAAPSAPHIARIGADGLDVLV